MMLTVVPDRELSEMKSSLRALQHKRDKLSLEIAETLGVTGFYALSQLNLNDPRVIPLRDQLYNVESKMDSVWKFDETDIDGFDISIKSLSGLINLNKTIANML